MQENNNKDLGQLLFYVLAGILGALAGSLLAMAVMLLYFQLMQKFPANPFVNFYGWVGGRAMIVYIPTGIIVGVLSLALFQKKEENRRRVMQAASKAPLILALAGVLAINGFLVGIGALYLGEQGFFVNWSRLPAPVKFTEIVDASTDTVWAKAEDGKLYSLSMVCSGDAQCGKWMQVEEVILDPYGFPHNLEKGASCQIGRFKNRGPSGKTIQCAVTGSAMGETSWTVYYALTEHKTLWYWRHTSDVFSLLYTPVFYSVAGAILGLFLGTVIFYRKTAQN